MRTCYIRAFAFVLSLASPMVAAAQGSIHGRVTDATSGFRAYNREASRPLRSASSERALAH